MVVGSSGAASLTWLGAAVVAYRFPSLPSSSLLQALCWEQAGRWYLGAATAAPCSSGQEQFWGAPCICQLIVRSLHLGPMRNDCAGSLSWLGITAVACMFLPPCLLSCHRGKQGQGPDSGKWNLHDAAAVLSTARLLAQLLPTAPSWSSLIPS